MHRIDERDCAEGCVFFFVFFVSFFRDSVFFFLVYDIWFDVLSSTEVRKLSDTYISSATPFFILDIVFN